MTQDNIKERIQKLYNKYLVKNITREEYEELFSLIRDDSNIHLVESIIDETLPGSNSLLEDLPAYDLGSAQASFSSNASPGIARRAFYKLAAAAAILLLLVTMVFLLTNHQEDWIVYSTDFQETKNLKLPDGSTVILNANSELKWKKGFEKEATRVVNFSGEGYFDITHLEGKDFVVKTGSIDVNVLGTEFNLETRRNFTNVFLKEGKVVLNGQDLQRIEMVPGDLVHYNTEQKQVNKISDQASLSTLSWKEGVFTFTDLTGIQILEKMEDIYGKEFIIEESGQLTDVIVVQGLPYTNWGFTREALELALGVNFIDSTTNKIIVKIK